MRRTLLYIALLLTLSCSNTQSAKTDEQLFHSGLAFSEQGNIAQATETFQKIIEQHPGTRYESFSYLHMANSQFRSGSKRSLLEAEFNYRVFLRKNSRSHLIPYVLERVIALSYLKNKQWFFGDFYDDTRDPKPYKNVIKEYQRFYLLYPNSLYLKKAQIYLVNSLESLASHEFVIGNWYYDHSLYPSAIARYEYLLLHYPNYSKSKQVVEKLIQTYKKNLQLDLATEIRRVYEIKFSTIFQGEKNG